MRRFGLTLIVIALSLAAAASLRADIVKLKNGSSVEGTVIKFGEQYRVKQADGTTKIVAEADVVSVTKSTTAAPAAPGAASGTSSAFASTKARAEAVDAPILAVTLWEKFIDATPTPADLTAAKLELDKWQKLESDDAERINGKWIGGAERRKLLKEVEQLCSEAREQFKSQTLQAIEKYEKVVKLYPNSFEANFTLGYYYLGKGAVGSTGRGNPAELDKAIRSLEVAVKLRPNSPSALSNLGVGYAFRNRWEEAVNYTYKAAKLRDSRAVVENLANVIIASPEGMKKNNTRVKPMLEDTVVLARKYGVSLNGTKPTFHYLAPEPPGSLPDENSADSTAQGPPGIVGNGSGFLVSADGYIVTNRHVVDEKNRLFRVRLDDGTEKPAEVVAIDAASDIALIKIKTDKDLPYLKLAGTDVPNPGAQCMVLGYPIASLLDFQMQVTNGQITSTSEKEEYQVTLTASTTHGNSGGPIVDRDGNVIGVLSAGATAYNVTYLKALSAGQIRSFLTRIKDKWDAKLTPGPTTYVPFDSEKLAKDTRRATLMVLIIRGDGKDVPRPEDGD